MKLRPAEEKLGMRPLRIIALLVVSALASWPTRSLAFVDLLARWHFKGGAAVNDHPVPRGQSFEDQFASKTLADVDSGRIFLVADSNTFGGYAFVDGKLKANARIGHLRASLNFTLFAQSTIPGTPGPIIAHVENTWAEASWRDSATITVPGLPQGFPLLVPTAINVPGGTTTSFPDTLADECCGFGDTRVFVRHIDGTPIGLERSYHNSPAIPDVDFDYGFDDPLGYIADVLRFENGVPHDIGFLLEVWAVGTAERTTLSQFPGSVATRLLADYGDSLTWGGITGVLNAETGEPVENWTITSESGFDYSKPFVVPEPTILVHLTFAVCAWLGWARPRRHRA